jgi:DNA modification methylase
MMINKSWFVLSGRVRSLHIPGSHVRYSEKLAKEVILQFTQKGDKILDPFAGFGTILLVAEKLGRIPYGIEYEQARVEYIKNQVYSKNPVRAQKNIIIGSALDIDKYALPKFDFCMTSPPYMRSFDAENPFSNYTKKGSYSKYLHDIKVIFTKIKLLMKKNSFIIIEISNTFGEGKPMTPLAWDVGKELSTIFFLEREIIHCAKEGNPSQGTNHSYLLIFRNKKG